MYTIATCILLAWTTSSATLVLADSAAAPPTKDYSHHIAFDVFTSQGNQTFKLAELAAGLRGMQDCSPTGKLAFVVPGWMDDGDEAWVLKLVNKYLEVRGGCVCVMKYGYFAIDINYFEVIGEFDGLADVLVRAIRVFLSNGFCPKRTYLFGFSLGARIAMYAASRVRAEHPFERLDLCDPAGFGFDGHREHTSFRIQGLADCVNCVHTSSFFGTRERRCDCDWILGECGKKQVAAMGGIADSHKLCTQFWIESFTHRFPAVRADEAKCGHDPRAVKRLADDENGPYYLGYQEDVCYPKGNYYVQTFKYPPYNNASCQHATAGATATVSMEW